MNWRERFKRSSAHTQANIVCTVLITVATIAYAIVANRQLREMRRTNKDTETALLNAKQESLESSKQFQVQLQHFDASLGVNQLQLGKLDSSIKEARRLATATEKANANVVGADRPWVGVMAFSVQPHEEGKTAKIRFTFGNTGKRPATVTTRILRTILKNLPPAPFAGTNIRSSMSFLLPGASDTSILSYELPMGLGADIRAGRYNEFFIAEITYQDVQTGTVYITHYCASFDPSNPDIPFPLCTRYNEAK